MVLLKLWVGWYRLSVNSAVVTETIIGIINLNTFSNSKWKWCKIIIKFQALKLCRIEEKITILNKNFYVKKNITFRIHLLNTVCIQTYTGWMLEMKSKDILAHTHIRTHKYKFKIKFFQRNWKILKYRARERARECVHILKLKARRIHI